MLTIAHARTSPASTPITRLAALIVTSPRVRRTLRISCEARDLARPTSMAALPRNAPPTPLRPCSNRASSAASGCSTALPNSNCPSRPPTAAAYQPAPRTPQAGCRKPRCRSYRDAQNHVGSLIPQGAFTATHAVESLASPRAPGLSSCSPPARACRTLEISCKAPTPCSPQPGLVSFISLFDRAIPHASVPAAPDVLLRLATSHRRRAYRASTILNTAVKPSGPSVYPHATRTISAPLGSRAYSPQLSRPRRLLLGRRPGFLCFLPLHVGRTLRISCEARELPRPHTMAA